MPVLPAEPTALHFAQALLPHGWAQNVRLTLERGCIAAVAVDALPRPGDDCHAIGLPGLPNLHSHAFQRGMAGLAETSGSGADSFWTWRAVMYRFLDRLDPDAVRIIATLAYAEMLEAGFTRVGEFHYLHHAADGAAYDDPGAMVAAIVAAAAETGIGLTLLPVFYAHSGFGGQPPQAQQRRFIHRLDSFAALRDRAAVLVAPLEDAVVGTAAHSLRAVTPAQLAALAEQSGSAPFHIHVAEQQREVADCLAWSGQRPVQWLLDHAGPDANWCLVHATHLDSAEISPPAGQSQDFVRSPRPIWATGSSRLSPTLPPEGATAWAAIRTC
jgi:formimidoylglutamate deiminase